MVPTDSSTPEGLDFALFGRSTVHSINTVFNIATLRAWS